MEFGSFKSGEVQQILNYKWIWHLYNKRCEGKLKKRCVREYWRKWAEKTADKDVPASKGKNKVVKVNVYLQEKMQTI